MVTSTPKNHVVELTKFAPLLLAELTGIRLLLWGGTQLRMFTFNTCPPPLYVHSNTILVIYIFNVKDLRINCFLGQTESIKDISVPEFLTSKQVGAELGQAQLSLVYLVLKAFGL